MRLLLISGFLGSGKTTLVLQLVQHAVERGQKVAILVNEIGEVGIDNQLMRQLDLNVWELLNGCICCTLSAGLVDTLHQLDREYSPDLVLIEPSGAADPRSILAALPYYRGSPLESLRTVAVLDPLRLPILMEVMTPLITAQIQRADLIIISKAEQAQAEELAFACRTAGEHNPEARVASANLRQPLTTELLHEIAPEIALWTR
jgi:G3E family GTPase